MIKIYQNNKYNDYIAVAYLGKYSVLYYTNILNTADSDGGLLKLLDGGVDALLKRTDLLASHDLKDFNERYTHTGTYGALDD